MILNLFGNQTLVCRFGRIVFRSDKSPGQIVRADRAKNREWPLNFDLNSNLNSNSGQINSRFGQTNDRRPTRYEVFVLDSGALFDADVLATVGHIPG